jgi:hypothetical protein
VISTNHIKYFNHTLRKIIHISTIRKHCDCSLWHRTSYVGRHLKSIITNMKKTPRRHTKHGQFHHVFFWRHTKHSIPYSPHGATWRARGLHASKFLAGSATTAIFGFVSLPTWCAMWIPFRNDVDLEIFDVWFVVAEVDFALCGLVCALLGLADVHWDM